MNMGKDIELIKTLMDDIPQLGFLENDELDILAHHINYQKAGKGSILFKEGTMGKTLYLIVKGKVEIKKESVSGNQTVLAQFGKGASIGEMSLIDESSRSATASVIEDAELLILDKEQFDEILDKYPEIGVKMLMNITKQISMRLRHTSVRFADVFDAR